MKKTISFLFLVAAISQGYGQILSPALNDAFVLPKGAFQITAGYSALGVGYDGESERYLRVLIFKWGMDFTKSQPDRTVSKGMVCFGMG